MDNTAQYYKRAEMHLKSYMVQDITPHLIDVVASVMMCRDNILPGGSTVQAICSNDLAETVSRADLTVVTHLPVIVAAHRYAYIEQLEYV